MLKESPCRHRGLNSAPLGYNESATLVTAPARHFHSLLQCIRDINWNPSSMIQVPDSSQLKHDLSSKTTDWDIMQDASETSSSKYVCNLSTKCITCYNNLTEPNENTKNNIIDRNSSVSQVADTSDHVFTVYVIITQAHGYTEWFTCTCCTINTLYLDMHIICCALYK